MQHAKPRVLSTILLLLLLLLPTRSVSRNCSEFQAVVARDAYNAAANSDACTDFVAATGGKLLIDWPCDDDACGFIMRDTATGLPDCILDGVNLRANVTGTIARCTPPPTNTKSSESNSSSSSTSTSTGGASMRGHKGDWSPATTQLISLILVVGLSFYL